jgi:hypothetical protein
VSRIAYRCTIHTLSVGMGRLGADPVYDVDAAGPLAAAILALSRAKDNGYPQVPATRVECVGVERDGQTTLFRSEREGAGWLLRELDCPEGPAAALLALFQKEGVP